jgi:hypothetical protein
VPGLTSFRTNMPQVPEIDAARAAFVLTSIDAILAWDKKREGDRDAKFVELGQYLCEVRSGQYWRLENLACFDDFLERRFPQSRRKAYYLMSIHEHLPPEVRRELKSVGWAKATELVKIARSEGKRFKSATWLHKARSEPKDEFKHSVEQHLTGKTSERYEILSFKFYKSQLPVIEEAIETAALMLGTEKSRGYCLEMICADFLAGVYLEHKPEELAEGVARLWTFLSEQQRRHIIHGQDASNVETRQPAA